MASGKGWSDGTPVNTKEKSQKALNQKSQSGKKDASK